MKSTLISKENNEGRFDAKFNIDFEWKELDDAAQKVFESKKKEFRIDGFRPGKAPRKLIEARYGEHIFIEQAISDLLQKAYPEAIEELELEPIDQPTFDFSEMKKGEDFTAKVEVMLYPEITIEGYKGVEITEVPFECTDFDLETELASRQKRNARMVEVDRPAKEGDEVIIDYVGTVDGEEFDGGKGESYSLKLGSHSFIPGFEEQIVGMKKGESKDLEVTFPEKYHEKSLAGKDAVFATVLHEVKEEELPELDDEFAKDTSEFDTLDELKEQIRQELTESKQESAIDAMKDAALGVVFDNNHFGVPEVMVEDEITGMINEYTQTLGAQGVDVEEYLKMMGQDMQAFRDEMKEPAYRKVKTRMIATAIAEQEGITATDEEIDTELNQIAAMYGVDVEQVRNMMGKQNLELIAKDLKMRKAVELIYENAVKTEPKEEPAEEAEGEAQAEEAVEEKAETEE